MIAKTYSSRCNGTGAKMEDDKSASEFFVLKGPKMDLEARVKLEYKKRADQKGEA